MMTTLQDDELEPYAVHALTGSGTTIGRLRLRLERLAPHFRVALITGENGTGKLAVARYMHRLSPVADRPVQKITASLFAGANEAVSEAPTLMLEDLGGAPPVTQGRLLTRLTALPREIRVLVLSDSDPRGMVAAGRLRPELYQRLGTIEIRVPALRERAEDMQEIAGAMLRRLGSGTELTEAAIEKLSAHDWRGNLRELWQVCGQIAGKAPLLQAQHIPASQQIGSSSAEPMRLEQVVRRHVLGVLERCAGNKLQAAETLGISRSTLYRMLDAAQA